jgi:hypothetical protein
MTKYRFAAAIPAGGMLAAPAAAEEYTAYENIEFASPASPECRGFMLLNLPPTWHSGDGAVILLKVGDAQHAFRDALVAALLHEQAAVGELLPMRCDAPPDHRDGSIAGALGALDAMSRHGGAGLVVVIGYGPGAATVLDAAHEPAAALLGPGGPRYAAAVAIGDGAPAFALGAPVPEGQQAPLRLAALCDALAAVAGGIGETPERVAPAAAAEACRKALAGEAALAASVSPAPRAAAHSPATAPTAAHEHFR